jgi:hypothetical protein
VQIAVYQNPCGNSKSISWCLDVKGRSIVVAASNASAIGGRLLHPILIFYYKGDKQSYVQIMQNHFPQTCKLFQQVQEKAKLRVE